MSDSPQSGAPAGTGGADGGEGALTREVVTELANEAVNRALGPRFKRQDAKFEERLNGLSSTILEKLEALQTSPAQSATGKNNQNEDGALAELKARVEQLSKQNEKLQKQHDAAKQEAAQQRNSRRKEHALSVTAKALRAVGVEPDKAVDLAENLHLVKGIVGYEGDDSDDVVFISDPDLDPVPLEQGIKTWIKTDAGKRWLPPAPGTGSGATRSRPFNANTGPDKQAQILDLAQQFAELA